MEVVTLEPGVWTQVTAHTAIQTKSNQSGLRLFYGEEAPAADTEAFFLLPEFALGPFRLPGASSFSNGLNVYMMPDENLPVRIVVY